MQVSFTLHVVVNYAKYIICLYITFVYGIYMWMTLCYKDKRKYDAACSLWIILSVIFGLQRSTGKSTGPSRRF